MADPERIEPNPPLTPGMLQAASDVSTPAPGAGGWVPSPAQRAIGVAVVTSLGALAPALLAAFPGRVGIICSCVLGALALGIGTLLGMNSAGPRKLS